MNRSGINIRPMDGPYQTGTGPDPVEVARLARIAKARRNAGLFIDQEIGRKKRLAAVMAVGEQAVVVPAGTGVIPWQKG